MFLNLLDLDKKCSILDLVFTNDENIISNLSYLPGLGKSVHVLLNFGFNCYTCSTNFKKYNFFKGNYAAIEEEMSTEDWCQSLQGLNLMESWDHLKINLPD